MIDCFSGVDTEFFSGRILWCFAIKACSGEFILNLKKGRSSHQYFITQEMGQSFMFLNCCTVFNLVEENFGFGRVGRGRGGIPEGGIVLRTIFQVLPFIKPA